MKLADLLSEEVVKIPLENTEKEKVIEELVDVLVGSGKVHDKEAVLKAVMEREKVMSTGVGDGVAIPHGKAEGVEDVVAAFGVAREDIDFESIDEKPVRLVFLLVAPPNATGPHLKALSRVSRLLNKKEFREQLLKAKSPKEVLELIQEEEKAYFEI
ncbi:MAG TPA: PTS sugar transporter subunit IIA [Bacteroidetes bacterium]|nr:PTS sugar transporter subunit IIA [Bacteroidota bacterium]